MWLYLLALAIIGLVILALAGPWKGEPAPREESPEAGGDDVDLLLSRAADQGLSAEDLETVQFDSAVRGYRMDQVDKLLDALTEQLRHARSEADGKSQESISG